MFAHLGRIVSRFATVIVALWLLAIVAASVLLVPRFTMALTGPPLGVRGSDSARHTQPGIARCAGDGRCEARAGEHLAFQCDVHDP